MTKIIAPLVIICCAGIFLLAGTTPTGAWFSDTVVIEGSSITTGSWSDAGSLMVTADKGLFKPPAGHHAGTILSGITVSNTGSTPVVITGVKVSWDPDDGGMIRRVAFTRVKGGGHPHAGQEGSGRDPDSADNEGSIAFWSGEAASGQVLDGRFLLNPPALDDPVREVQLSFDSDMDGKSLLCMFIMNDGSEKEIRVQA